MEFPTAEHPTSGIAARLAALWRSKRPVSSSNAAKGNITVTVSRHNNVQVDLDVKFNGVVPASERRQIYEIMVYFFLPRGFDAVQSERPLSLIWTSSRLHTPKIAIEHLCTHYAPVMLAGQFNASLQDVRHKTRVGKDTNAQVSKILHQLYLQSAIYEATLKQEVEATVRKIRYPEAGSPDPAESTAQVVTIAVKHVIEAIQRLQQVCSACEAEGTLTELAVAWKRTHEHILLTAQNGLLKLLQAFDRHLRDQGIHLVQQASTSALPSVGSVADTQRTRSKNLGQPGSAGQTRQPANLRELLLQLAGGTGGSGEQHTGAKHGGDTVVPIGTPPQRAGSASLPPVKKHPSGANGMTTDGHIVGDSKHTAVLLHPIRSSPSLGASKLLGMGRTSQVAGGEVATFGSESAREGLAQPASSWGRSGVTDLKHVAIADAAARTLNSSIQRRTSAEDEALYMFGAEAALPRHKRRFSSATVRDQDAASKPASAPPPQLNSALYSRSQSCNSREVSPAERDEDVGHRNNAASATPAPSTAANIPNPFAAAARDLVNRAVENPRRISRTRSKKSKASSPADVSPLSSSSQLEGLVAEADREMRSRLGAALLRRETAQAEEGNTFQQSEQKLGVTGECEGVTQEKRTGSSSGFDSKLEASKSYTAFPKPLGIRSGFQAVAPSQNREHMSRQDVDLPVKLSGPAETSSSSQQILMPASDRPATTSTPPERAARLSVVSPFSGTTELPWEKSGAAGDKGPEEVSGAAGPELRSTGSEECRSPPQLSLPRLTASQSLTERRSSSMSAASLLVARRGSGGARDSSKITGHPSPGEKILRPSSAPRSEVTSAIHGKLGWQADDNQAVAQQQEEDAPQLYNMSSAPVLNPEAGPKAKGLDRSSAIMRGSLDQTEQLRRFALMKTQTRRKISYMPPPHLARGQVRASHASSPPSPQEESSESGQEVLKHALKEEFEEEEDEETEAAEDQIASTNSAAKEDTTAQSEEEEEEDDQAGEWKNPATVAAKLRAARARLLEGRASITRKKPGAKERPEGEKGLRSKLSLLNKRFRHGLGDAEASANLKRTEEEVAREQSTAADSPKSIALLPLSKPQSLPLPQPLPLFMKRTEPFVPYVKPKQKLLFGRGARAQASHHRQRSSLEIASRDDSVGALMYVHTPTPSPFEDVVNPLPSRMSRNKPRKHWKQKLSSSDFLGGEVADRLERHQLAKWNAVSSEAARQPLYVHTPTAATASEEEPETPEHGPLEMQSQVEPLLELEPQAARDKQIDAILQAVKHPKNPVSSDQSVTLGRSQKLSLPGDAGNHAAKKRKVEERPDAGEETTENPRGHAVPSGGGAGARTEAGCFGDDTPEKNSDEACQPGADVEKMVTGEYRRKLRKSRLKALRTTKRQTGAKFEMQRWGEAFRKIRGLAGVLRKARALHLSHAEQLSVAATTDDVHANALLKQTRTLLCLAIDGCQEERQQQGFHASVLDAETSCSHDAAAFAARSALVAKTGLHTTTLIQKPVMPRPGLSDVFAWLTGLVAIVLCGVAIDLAHRPLTSPADEYQATFARRATLVLRNDTRATTVVLIAISIIAVWVLILKDRWASYEHSLNLLGLVARRRTVLSDHSGKHVGKAAEMCQRLPDTEIKEEVLVARHSHKGFLPGERHPDRPELVMHYSREVHFSWNKLEGQMQAVDGIDFKTRVDLSNILVRLDDPTSVHQRLRPASAGQLPAVEEVLCPRTQKLHCVVSVRQYTKGLRVHGKAQLHKVKLVVKQSGIESVHVMGDADARKSSCTKDHAHRTTVSKDAVRELLQKADTKQCLEALLPKQNARCTGHGHGHSHGP